MNYKMKILDCTLRDGGYYNNWEFNRELINEYLKVMNNLEIDFVEIGFRFFDYGIKIKMVKLNSNSVAVDEIKDIKKAEKILKKKLIS